MKYNLCRLYNWRNKLNNLKRQTKGLWEKTTLKNLRQQNMHTFNSLILIFIKFCKLNFFVFFFFVNYFLCVLVLFV